ncbi:MAG: hypothetical protein LBJ67_10855 [Planctomycetaceae bacterium]|jgi:hypothetical protein|nr:hypothetical protein [Planctomycetaceae bacterium]
MNKFQVKKLKQFTKIISLILSDVFLLLAIAEHQVFAQACCNEVTQIVERPISELPLAILSDSIVHTASYPANSFVADTYRIEKETQYREEEQTSYRQVWDEEVRERKYTVYKNVPETTIKQEIYKVLRPTWATEYRDTSYDVIKTVPETSFHEEHRTVSRPVWETAERTIWQTVRRPVSETIMQERQYTVNRPVTTYKTETVDRGQYVNYTAVEPGKTYHRLAWQSGGTYVNPITGANRYQLPGLYWTPMQAESKLRQETIYQPNYVSQLVPVTTLMPETITEQSPVNRVTYQEERIARKEPYQVMRMVQEEVVNQVPVTTYRQVVQRVQQTTPVQVYKLETEEVAREIPVTTYKRIAEEHVEPYTVKIPRVEKVIQKVMKPYTVEKRIPLDELGNPITTTSNAALEPNSPSGETFTTYGGQPTQATPENPANQKPVIPPPGILDLNKNQNKTGGSDNHL